VYNSQWQNWVKGQVLAEDSTGDLPEMVNQSRVSQYDSASEQAGVIAKLVKDKALITENTLRIHYNHIRLCKAIISDDKFQTTMSLIEEERKSFNRVQVLTPENVGWVRVLTEIPGYIPATEDQKIFFWKTIATNRDFAHEVKCDRVYLPEAVDMMYTTSIMRVNRRLIMRPSMMGPVRSMTVIADTTAWKEKFLIEQAIDYLKGENVPYPEEYINIDQFLIEEARVNYTHKEWPAIVTDDIKLCKKIASDLQCSVQRIPVKMYLAYTEYNLIPGIKLTKIPSLFKWKVLKDTQSIEAGVLKYTHDASFLEREKKAKYTLGNWEDALLHLSNVEPTTEYTIPKGWPRDFLFVGNVKPVKFNSKRKVKLSL